MGRFADPASGPKILANVFRCATVLYSVVAIFSCANPALMVLDDASEAYYEWQGYGTREFAQAAADRGFDLTIKKVISSAELVETVERAYVSARKNAELVLILPSAFGIEARRSAERFEHIRVLFLGESDLVMPPGDAVPVSGKLVSVSTDRLRAFGELGEWVRSVATPDGSDNDETSSEPLKVFACFVENSDKSREELTRFLDALGPVDEVVVRRLSATPSSEDIRGIVEHVRGNAYQLLLLFTGEGNPLILKALSGWSGRLVTENAAGIANDMPLLVAGIDLDWSEAFSDLLGEVDDSDGTGMGTVTVEASFEFFRSIPEETFASSSR